MIAGVYRAFPALCITTNDVQVRARLQSLPAKLAQMAQSDASAPTEVSSMEDAAAAGADDDALDDFPPNLAEAEGANAGAIAVAQSSSSLGRVCNQCGLKCCRVKMPRLIRCIGRPRLSFVLADSCLLVACSGCHARCHGRSSSW